MTRSSYVILSTALLIQASQVSSGLFGYGAKPNTDDAADGTSSVPSEPSKSSSWTFPSMPKLAIPKSIPGFGRRQPISEGKDDHVIKDIDDTTPLSSPQKSILGSIGSMVPKSLPSMPSSIPFFGGSNKKQAENLASDTHTTDEKSTQQQQEGILKSAYNKLPFSLPGGASEHAKDSGSQLEENQQPSLSTGLFGKTMGAVSGAATGVAGLASKIPGPASFLGSKSEQEHSEGNLEGHTTGHGIDLQPKKSWLPSLPISLPSFKNPLARTTSKLEDNSNTATHRLEDKTLEHDMDSNNKPSLLKTGSGLMGTALGAAGAAATGITGIVSKVPMPSFGGGSKDQEHKEHDNAVSILQAKKSWLPSFGKQLSRSPSAKLDVDKPETDPGILGRLSNAASIVKLPSFSASAMTAEHQPKEKSSRATGLIGSVASAIPDSLKKLPFVGEKHDEEPQKPVHVHSTVGDDKTASSPGLLAKAASFVKLPSFGASKSEPVKHEREKPVLPVSEPKLDSGIIHGHHNTELNNHSLPHAENAPQHGHLEIQPVPLHYKVNTGHTTHDETAAEPLPIAAKQDIPKHFALMNSAPSSPSKFVDLKSIKTASGPEAQGKAEPVPGKRGWNPFTKISNWFKEKIPFFKKGEKSN